MLTLQMKQAIEDMSAWLSHPAELGRKPRRIACAGMFVQNDLNYYIIKFKCSILGPWIVGVCGGYEGNSLKNCGQAFSQMNVYRPETAERDCRDMVEMISNYWIQRMNQ